MENASDALIMAGQVLIFLVALTVCISSYTTLRVQIDRIIGQTETISLAKDKDSNQYINFIESKSNGSIRKVGAETIVSTISRAPKENYVVYIKLSDYTSIGSDVVVSKATKDITIKGQKIISTGDKVIKVTNGYNTNQNVNSILKNGFYKKIKEKRFWEYLGEYQDESAPGVSTENKQVKRLVTYIEAQ